MAKQVAPLEFNSLSGGLVTEANALTFPDNASLDEVNFELTRDGSRVRRFGLEEEINSVPKATTYSYTTGSPDLVTNFLWENVSGNPSVSILVVQLERELHMYLTSSDSISEGAITDTVWIGDKGSLPYGFANVDGTLIVVTGGRDVHTVVADLTIPAAPTFNVEKSRLTIRDLFGIDVQYNRAVEGDTPEDYDYIELTDPEYVTKRPLAAGLVGDIVVPEAYDFITSETVTEQDTVGYLDTITTVTGEDFFPTTYLGYTISKFVATSRPARGTLYLSVVFTAGAGVPSFSGFEVTDRITEATYSFTRSDTNQWTYTANLSLSAFAQLKANVPAGLDFTIGVSEDTPDANQPYKYNLRNQTFATKRLPKTTEVVEDPIQSFITASGKYPSMADTVLSALYNNLDATNKTAERFHAEDLVVNAQGNFPAPKGYFIIDALTRSQSREARWNELIADQGYPEAEGGALPPDLTPGGPTAVAEYGGRAWFGGFSEEGTAPSNLRLDSYLMYSQLTNHRKALTQCYQKGDPTSVDAPELLETDGGFLSLDGAYGINNLVPLGNSLIAFGQNGVWAVSGGDGNYFTPTNPRVQKVSDEGCVSPRSVIVIDTSILFWAKRGIYLLSIGQAGTYKLDNLTEKTIQTYYDGIPYTAKVDVVGGYDSYTSTATWTVNNSIANAEKVIMLKLMATTGAFTTSVIEDGAESRTVVGPVKVPPVILASAATQVLVGIDNVVVGEDVVVIPSVAIEPRSTDISYLTIKNIAGRSWITFANFTNPEFKDWGEVDAQAYMVTGYVSGGDFQRHKQVPYITFHFERTEDGFAQDVLGDWYPTHESGCLVQAQWDWANSATSGRWGREFQAYRYRTQYMPSDVNDTYDSGFSTIVTKNRIRGKGRVLSLKISSEAGKDCRILGWSAMMGVNNRV